MSGECVVRNACRVLFHPMHWMSISALSDVTASRCWPAVAMNAFLLWQLSAGLFSLVCSSASVDAYFFFHLHKALGGCAS